MDYNSSLPVRSEADGTDERLHVKIVDGTNPAINQVQVDGDKNLHVEMHGNDPAALDRVMRLSELGAVTPDGVYDVANNTKPGNLGMIAHVRAVTPGDSDQTIRLTGKNSTVNTNVWALDVAITDENANPFSDSNPLPVTWVDNEGSEVNSYQTSAAVAAAASVNFDYTVTALKTLKLSQIHAAGSGKMKSVLQVETGVGTGIFTTYFVKFNSTAETNICYDIRENIPVAAGVKVRHTLTNLDKAAQDLYSTVCGHEI